MSKSISTAAKTDGEEDGGPMLSRRRALQAGAAGAAATAMPVAYSREAEAVVPAVVAGYLTWTVAGKVAAVGLTAAGGFAVARWTSPDSQDSETLHQQQYGSAISEGAQYNAVLNDALNEIPRVTATAQDEAIYQAEKARSEGASEADAISAAIAGVNEVFSQVAKDLFVGQDLALEWFSLGASNAIQAQLTDAIRAKTGGNATVTGNNIDLAKFGNATTSPYTLWNGEEIELLNELDVGDGGAVLVNWRPDENVGASEGGYARAGIQDPSATTVTTGDIAWVTDPMALKAAFNEIDSQRQTVINDASTIVSNVYTNAQLDGEDFDITDYLSPAQLAARVSTEWGVSNSVAWQIANAAFYGYAIGDVGVTVQANYTPHGETDAQAVEGSLFGELPSETIAVGDSITNVDGVGDVTDALWFMNVREDETAEVLELAGTLDITGLKDAEGADVTSMDTWTYDLGDIEGTTLDLAGLREDLRNAIATFEAAAEDSSGGGAFGGAGGAIALVVAIIVGGAAVASGGSSGGQKRY